MRHIGNQPFQNSCNLSLRRDIIIIIKKTKKSFPAIFPFHHIHQPIPFFRQIKLFPNLFRRQKFIRIQILLPANLQHLILYGPIRPCQIRTHIITIIIIIDIIQPYIRLKTDKRFKHSVILHPERRHPFLKTTVQQIHIQRKSHFIIQLSHKLLCLYRNRILLDISDIPILHQNGTGREITH